MDKVIKAVFFDIDGTLLNSSGKALASTKKAIEAANKKGILVGVATGRGPYRLNARLDYLPIDIYITYNGQLIYSTMRTLYEETFDKKLLAHLITFAEKNNRQMLFGTRYQLLGSYLLRFSQRGNIQKLVKLLPRWFPVMAFRKFVTMFKKVTLPTNYDHLHLLEKPVYQCVMLSPMGELSKLKEEFPECHFTRSNKITVDIIPKGGSKLSGIKKIIAPFEINLDEVMVFGDSWNDIEMLEAAGFGVAMGNAPKEVQKRAAYVTKSHDEDGIYEAFVHFGIIQEEN